MLLLDEPSNDLDVETLRALEEALLEFRRLGAGGLARSLVPRPHRHAHPRRRRRLEVGVLRGQLHEYENDKRKRLGEEGARPHRPRYKPLMQ